MTVFFEQIGSELSLIRAESLTCDWNQSLHFCQVDFVGGNNGYQPTDEDDFIHDVLLKGLRRGKRPFPSYHIEQQIIAIYGGPFAIRPDGSRKLGSIRYIYDSRLIDTYQGFSDLIDPWQGDPDDVAFDPDNPQNERKLFEQLLCRYGRKIAHCIGPQVDLASILAPKEATNFAGQRADLLLSFPNGRALLLEPGDHTDPTQIMLDKKRDAAFTKVGIETLRPSNTEIQNEALYHEIRGNLLKLDSERFLDRDGTGRTEELLAANYLFLLPSLVARVERLLLHFLFHQGMIHWPELRIGIIEHDLECAELALSGFVEKLDRLTKLFGLSYEVPPIRLYVQRNPAYRYGDLRQLGLRAQDCKDFEGTQLDIVLDVGIKCNSLTRANLSAATQGASARQSFPHNHPVRFGYRARPVTIDPGQATDELLATFVQDYFRKKALRPGQGPILRNVLAQKSTIGLLPTSAGKSLCYQLASLLMPGMTIVVDPLIALMRDQVQSLTEQYGIDRVLAWHAGAGLQDENVAALLSENLMIFISPERLQRPGFRSAMKMLKAGDIYVTYAVIDEAHCVSMWGHDFRPSYLMLEKNFKDYCTFQGREPVLVALTGTASQLVLIDLKRELDIHDFEAIIRPDTFDRPELQFNLVSCSSDDKVNMLTMVKNAIAQRLNVQNLETDAHGIIFAYTPKEVWELFGQHVGDAQSAVQTVLNGHDHQLRFGAYTGQSPSVDKKPLFPPDQWDKYKEQTLAAFKRGRIQMLFGNTAVSVGIDNEQLNYVINYKMPQSMEAYYQQCGRAGRNGQTSECYLIFSDDAPQQTQDWLNRDISQMPKRWDDIGTVVYFHQNNFPSQKIDCEGAERVFKRLFGKQDKQGLVAVPQFLDPKMGTAEAERTERYISYWLILGVLIDYEVTGSHNNTVYHVRRHPAVEKFLQNKNEMALKSHIVDHLQAYLSRYRPTSRTDVENRLDAHYKQGLSSRSVAFLVDFIYMQIEYQRREAIRTVVTFCNEKDTSPETLRARVKAYFDTSEKFSEGLLAMADALPNADIIVALLERIDGFDDVEHLYWETRRLLDERFRADWAAANLFAVAYREQGLVSEVFMRLFKDMIAGLQGDPQVGQSSAATFLCGYLAYYIKLDSVFGEEVASALLAKCFEYLLHEYGLTYLGIIEELNVPPDVRDFLHLDIAVLQLREVTNAHYSRVIG